MKCETIYSSIKNRDKREKKCKLIKCEPWTLNTEHWQHWLISTRYTKLNDFDDISGFFNEIEFPNSFGDLYIFRNWNEI